MNLSDIEAEVARIERSNGDYEIAHGMEDKLREEFISFVAAHGPEPFNVLAAAILKTADIDFPRYCA